MKDSEIINNIQELSAVCEDKQFIHFVQTAIDEDETLDNKYITNIKLNNAKYSKFEGENLYFENCTFEKMCFKKSYFKNVIFKNCDLSNSNFSESTFSNCKFKNVKGLGADFSESVFKDVNIQDCMLRYGVFTGSLFNFCHIEESDMTEAYIDNCKIKKLSVDSVNLIKATLYKTLLKGIDLRTCSIEGVIFSIEGKELKGAVVDLFQAAELAKSLGIIIK